MIEEKHDKNETFLYEKSRCSLVVGFEKIGSIIFYYVYGYKASFDIGLHI